MPSLRVLARAARRRGLREGLAVHELVDDVGRLRVRLDLEALCQGLELAARQRAQVLELVLLGADEGGRRRRTEALAWSD